MVYSKKSKGCLVSFPDLVYSLGMRLRVVCNHSMTFAPVDGHLLMQWWFSVVGVEGDDHPACHTHLLSLSPPLEEGIRLLPDLVHLAINCECHLLKGLKQVTRNPSNAPWGQKMFLISIVSQLVRMHLYNVTADSTARKLASILTFFLCTLVVHCVTARKLKLRLQTSLMKEKGCPSKSAPCTSTYAFGKSDDIVFCETSSNHMTVYLCNALPRFSFTAENQLSVCQEKYQSHEHVV